MTSYSDGVIVILSYPDTVVRPAYTEFSSKIWPKIGIGSKDAVKAGHAALLLIKKNHSNINYYDFGRYITTFGYGRVRSSKTDPELEINLNAKFNKNKISNLEEILLWLEKHPDKTHGEGRLIASVNYNINYSKALNFIDNLINKKEIPYGAFIKNGTNCARFVTDTIINSCTIKSVVLKLKSSYLLTPSPIGNVIKGKTDNLIYSIKNQLVKDYKNRSVLKEYNAFLTKKINKKPNLIGTEIPDSKSFYLENGTWLGGIGSGAWFHIEKQIDLKKFRIARYCYKGKKEFESDFITDSSTFDLNKKYDFIHPSNCKEVFIKQSGKEFLFQIVNHY